MSFMETPRLLPLIVNERTEADVILLDLQIPEDLAYFAGHFPRVAVVPGVVQIHWAVHFARRHFPWLGVFQRMEAVKFKELLLPGQSPRLRLQGKPEKASLSFVYYSDDREYSSGRLYFHPADV